MNVRLNPDDKHWLYNPQPCQWCDKYKSHTCTLQDQQFPELCERYSPRMQGIKPSDTTFLDNLILSLIGAISLVIVSISFCFLVRAMV